MATRLNFTAPALMSLSFDRIPTEHIRVNIAAGRRFAGIRLKNSMGVIVGIFVAVVLYGLLMELYRRNVLPLITDGRVFPSWPDAVLYYTPMFLAYFLIIVFFIRVRRRKALQTMLARFSGNQRVDVEIFIEGLVFFNAGTEMMTQWSAVRDIAIHDKRIDLDLVTSCHYIPARAFADTPVFLAGFKEITALWNAGKVGAPPESASELPAQLA